MKNLFLIFSILFSFIAIGQTWQQIGVPTTKKLNDIDFPSANVGYIVGNDSLIMKTIDGGVSWNILPTGNINFWSNADDIVQVNFLTEDIGYISSLYAGTHRTIDGGQTWELVIVQGNLCFPNAVFPIDSSNVFIGGAGCFEGALINRYMNGISTQMTINFNTWNTAEPITDFDFKDANNGIASMANKYILKTVDAGITWDSISTNLEQNQTLTSVLWYDDTTCYAGYKANGGGFGILVSEDEGLTWSQDVNSATFAYPDFTSVSSSDNGDVFVGAIPSWGGEGAILTKDFNLGFWVYNSVDQPINGIDSFGDSTTFAVGDSGYVVVNQPISNLGISNFIKEENVRLYPNPAQNTISIICDYCKSPSEKVILNMQGQKVLEVSQNENIDVSRLHPGIYCVYFKGKGTMLKFVKD